MAGFNILSGTPKQNVELYCIKCDKVILPRAPLDVEMEPEGISLSSLMGSAGCLTKKHKMILRSV